MDLHSRSGALIVNADDWGVNCETTNRILECFQQHTISSASGMVFMVDSERAAALAHEHCLDVGLHLNLTTPPSALPISERLVEHHEAVSRFLLKSRLSPIIYHPGLANSFEYLVLSQLDEYARLYGNPPAHIDGHHHMHLCANVVLGKLLPAGVSVRRNFTFFSGEKSCWNLLYRRFQDAYVNRRHPMPDYLFDLSLAVRSGGLERICSLSQHAVVELETHPGRSVDYQLLMGGRLVSLPGDVRVASCFVTPVLH